VTEAILRDLKLIGTTSSSGGRFQNVRVTGEALLTGDTDCRKLFCVGNMDIQGSLRADTVRLTGNGKIKGNLRASQLVAIGEVDVSGGIRADRLKVTGGLRIVGNCEAESLELSGALSVGGLLNAERLTVKIHGPCRAQEIGGGTVTVRRSRAVALKKMFGHWTSAELTTDLIEGDTVYLEYTRAEVVRGNHVTLGPGCDIGRVEYRGVLKIGKNTTVKEKVQL
jgi:cytoskeletal protein CcmA (bactofilin family)